jgi:aminobenzoyl-glutamate utilization protein B
MKKFSRIRITFLFVAVLLLATVNINGQKVKDEGSNVKADLYKSKKDALLYLNDNEVIKKYGEISDAIWNYAELAMQEFKSSALLIKTLEEEGFTVDKGVAGMPTCFVATWGSGKPVIGILGEFDALPMLSQKALSPIQIPVVEGAPGHGCGHNMMGTAGIAAAIAVKRSMELNKVKGTIKFFGSPAEEAVISRPYMVRENVFNDVDAIIAGDELGARLVFELVDVLAKELDGALAGREHADGGA